MSVPDLTAMFSELNKAIHVSDYRQVLKIANKILHTKEGNTDAKATHCKVVSMIYLNQFSEALKFIQSSPSCSDLVFEKAYCQYRLLMTDKALETIEECKDLDIKLMELKAQVLYKLGMYDQSFDLYRRLMKECADDYEEERKTNMFAVHASNCLWENKEQPDLELELTSYEQMYNKACKLLGEGRAVEGEKMLERALAECQEYFEEDPDMTEEEIEGELAVIRVQLGYAYQLQNRDDEALTIYNQVIKSRPSDIGLVAVASNNIITINKEQNVFDSKKKMKATLVPDIQEKLVPRQMTMVELNRALLFMYSNQWEPCRKLLKALQRKDKLDVIPCLIQAAELCREKNTEKAINYLEDYIENYPGGDSTSISFNHVKITLAQLLLSQGHTQRACDLLGQIEDICHTPAVVSVMVSIHDSKKGGESKAIKVLDDAVDWHRKNKSSSEMILKLMWESSQYKLRKKKSRQAAETLEAMRRLDPNNVKVLAHLIFAYSQYDAAKAHQISEDLPSLEQLSVRVDVKNLEKNALSLLAPRYVKRQAKQQQKLQKEMNKSGNAMAGGDVKVSKSKDVVSEAQTDQIIKTKKKKKRKKRLPKNYDPNVEPDPERWLPLQERSYYKGRRKDRKKCVGKGTQGSAAMSSDAFDMSGKATGSGGSTPASPKPGANVAGSNPGLSSPKPAAVRPKAKQVKGRKKKGGKGGKW